MATQTSRRPQGRRPYSGSGSGAPGRTSSPSRSRSPQRGGGSRFGGGGGGRSGGGGGRRGGGGRKQPSFDPSQFINKNPVQTKEDAYVAKHKFTDFGLNAQVSELVAKQGITIPSPIQDKIIPLIMKGKDVIGIAETGTGKTAAFLLPMIEKTIKDKSQMTLVMTPTRELAIQIEMELRKFSGPFKMYSTTCVGGTPIRPQIMKLRRNNHFVIGTPGRILDLIERGDLKTERISNVVLDEADRMLDMGFIHDMRRILSTVTNDRQTMFFSATMTNEAEKLVNDFMRNPTTVSVKKKDVTNSIAQDVVIYEHTHKFDNLLKLLENEDFKRVIIFGSMKHSVEKLSNELCSKGIRAESIHGNKSHGQRQRSLSNFKSGNARVLVATDVAARGIHVDNVSHVINYDLPNTFEDYVHRIGRTGRGDHKGQALTFVAKH